MAGKSRTHSENWWASNASPIVLRCTAHYKSTGEQCRRVAEDGAVVCDQHGGAAGQVRRRAAQRIAVTADDAAQKLAAWMDDPQVPFQVRAKIAQDLLDRAGLSGPQVHKIMPITEDPIEKLFASILADDNGLLSVEAEPAALAPLDVADDYDDEDEDILGFPLPVDQDEAAEPKSDPTNPSKPPKHIREGLGVL